MKILKLNNLGFGHLMVPLFLVLGTGIFGSYMVVKSHATSLNPNTTKVMPVFNSATKKIYLAANKATKTNKNTTENNGCLIENNACYFWIGAEQTQATPFAADGATVSMLQAAPKVPATDYHSLSELYVGSANSLQGIEVGWMTTPQNPKPRLWVFHWVNGNPTCYDGCGFVALKSKTPLGTALKVGAVGTFKIYISGNKWYVSYNGSNIGYFPLALWSSNNAIFQTVSTVLIYAETCTSDTQTSHTQMGNGLSGILAQSAYFSDYHLINSATPSVLTPFQYDSYGSAYSISRETATGFHYGGPGGMPSPL